MADPRPRPVLRARPGPRLDEFQVLARDRRVIPVVRRLMADAETPVGVYRKLAKDQPGTFLLESAEHGGVWSRYSIVGAACRATLTEHDGEAVLGRGAARRACPTTGNPPRGAARHRRRAGHRADRGPATADRRHGRGDHLRRRAPLGAGPADRTRRAGPARDRHDARHRPRGPRPRRRLAAPRRQRGQLRRHRRAGRGRLGRRGRAPRPDDRRPGRSPPRAPSPSSTATGRGGHGQGREQLHARAPSRRWSRRPRRPSGPARSSRSWSPSGSRLPCPADAARRLPRAAHVQPQPLHVPVPAPGTRTARHTTSSARPEALVKVTGAPGHHPPHRRLAPARQDPRGRRTRSPRTCSPTPRSAPSTSCSSTSAATTSSGCASRARSTWSSS